MSFGPESMAPLMFVGLVVFLLIGYPVAFSLMALGLAFGLLGLEMGFFMPGFLANMPLRVFGILSNDLLLAIPFFTFMGCILERCGLAEDLLESMGQAFGALPGGLAYSVILVGVIPSLGLIFVVLRTIFMGLATPTESGAMGAVGALILAGLRGRLTVKLVWGGMESTMRITAMVIFILIGSSVFALVFQGFDGGLWIEHMLTDLPGGRAGFLIAVMAFVFVLAFFLDFFEIAFIVVPLLAPVAQKLGIDLVWFGVLLCVNMQTSYMHPPFGYALFYLRGIAPKEVKSKDIYLGAIPWVGLQLLMVALVIAFPARITAYLDKPQVIDVDNVKIELDAPTAVPSIGAEENDGGPPDSADALQTQIERSIIADAGK
ncbi:MAG: TRAP transporter large permease subunit [Burkholderiales bacterium]